MPNWIKTITKNDIAKELAIEFRIARSLAYKIVNDLFIFLASQVMAGNRIEIRGFGVFTKKSLKQRDGRNPRNGEPIKIESRESLKFKSSKKIDHI